MSKPIERVEIISGRERRKDLQVRLCPREPKARRHLRPAALGRMVRGLQHHPPSQRLANALATWVHLTAVTNPCRLSGL